MKHLIKHIVIVGGRQRGPQLLQKHGVKTPMLKLLCLKQADTYQPELAKCRI